MAKKKIVISKAFIESLAKEESIDDISLKFNISDTTHSIKLDLTPLLNNSLQRRKDLKKFKDYLINIPKSVHTKKTIAKTYKKFVLAIGDKFDSQKNLLENIKNHAVELRLKVEGREISQQTYTSYRWQLYTIFNECYGVENRDFFNVFPEYSNRTGRIDNLIVLDTNGNEKNFSKEQYKEITKFLLTYNLFLEKLITQNSDEKNFVFEYKDIYKINFNLKYQPKRQLKNKNTFCLMLIFIALTGLNLMPLIKIKRSSLIIDKERENISFKVTCNRKGREQSHNYPMRKSQLEFFEKVLQNSHDIALDNDILFPYISNSLTNNESRYFNSDDFVSFYENINQGFYGNYLGIKITARKLRQSFGNQFDDIDSRSVALFNSINTAAKNYSQGNAEENNQQLQKAMNIYTIALSNSEDIQIVRNNIEKINTIQIKDIPSLKKENSQITSSGIFCINSKEGGEPEKFARRMEKLKLENIESINCANILACFNCKNSIIVNDFENIYLLKSFYNYLNNIIYDSDTSSLFSDQNAVKNAITSIQIVLENKIDKKLIKKIEKHIEKYGVHPLWDIAGDFA